MFYTKGPSIIDVNYEGKGGGIPQKSILYVMLSNKLSRHGSLERPKIRKLSRRQLWMVPKVVGKLL